MRGQKERWAMAQIGLKYGNEKFFNRPVKETE